MTLSDLAKYSVTRSARGLSATAELLVNMADEILPPCNVERDCGIMTLNSPGGSTLQRNE